ncbi:MULTISPECIES: hypothetical protein [unclassified Fibrobacter]|uniref:hypothetical protein n=1 Tax=unclassified Fibrobacter TaxID=2634177 RepID=UPI00092149B8|nr:MULTISPECIES: hypothetical protein [unclassified Fibrobacter]SHL03472.1 hypothetical protein SAMN05720759_11438 [Fibrobacter sp. UWB12]SIO46403.1 hypothetical protein SAMN05720758_3088 [Fibrobacter sp. UWB11]
MNNDSNKEKSLFKKLTALPYLLVFLALLMPLANVSCSAKEDSKPIAEMTFYQVASGVDLDQSLVEPALGQMHRMVKENPKVLDRFKTQMPNFPKMESVHHLYGILAAVFLAAVFAWLVPLASTVMGLLSMISLWSLLMKLSHISETLGIPLLKVEAGIGLYCASFLILIGTAMNIATMVRPAVMARRARKKQK